MDIDPALLNRLSFQSSDSVPEGYRGRLLPGAAVLAAVGLSGTILLQDYKDSLYEMQFSTFQLSKGLSFHTLAKPFLLQACIALRNGIRYFAQGIGHTNIREGQSMTLHAPGKEFEAIIEAGKEIQLFEFYFSGQLLNELVQFFPILDRLLVNKASTRPYILQGQPVWADSKVKDIAFSILDSPYDERLQHFYFESKVRECLFLLLAQASEEPPEKIKVSAEEMEKVHAVKNELLEGMGRQLTIAGLSRMVNMNEFKLKYAFQHTFGMGMFEYQKQERLKEAKRLMLETNKPPKEIARIVGYARVTSFITEFRKHFGYTPGSLRRK